MRVRVGIHTAPLVVGNIGAPSRINYTVVGDTVNTTQRLESLGKEIAPDDEVVILISEATLNRLPAEFHQIGRIVPGERENRIRLDPSIDLVTASNQYAKSALGKASVRMKLARM